MDTKRLKQKIDNRAPLNQKEKDYLKTLIKEVNMTRKEYEKLAEEIHQNNIEKGFWNDNQGDSREKIVLIVSELVEALEGDRKEKHANKESFFLSQEENEFNSFKERFEVYIKDTVEDELADVGIRVLDLIQRYKEDQEFIYFSKDFYVMITDEDEKFSHHIYTMIRYLMNYITYTYFVEDLIRFFTVFIEYCKDREVDIDWHIQQKVAYNKTRKHKHGKTY